MNPVVRVKRKGQITLPVAVRKKLAIREGDMLSVAVQGRRVLLEPVIQGQAVAVLVDARHLDALVGVASLGGDAVADAARYDE